MENNIANILAGCRLNERKSQKDLYQLFHKSILSVCYRYENRSEITEQLVTESFVSTFKKLAGHHRSYFAHNNDYSSIQHWIKQIAVSICIAYFRKAHGNHSIHHAPEENSSHDEQPLNRENIFSPNQIIEAIRKLPAGERIVYNLFAIERMSHKNIAAHLTISISDSQSALERARSKLKSLLFGEALNEENNLNKLQYPLTRTAP